MRTTRTRARFYELASRCGETITWTAEIPTVFLQEGGIPMDKIGEAAADVVEAFRSQRK
jgi:hypothetical protein